MSSRTTSNLSFSQQTTRTIRNRIAQIVLAVAFISRLKLKGSLALLALLTVPNVAIAQTPPPVPSSTSTLLEAVTNPITGNTAIVDDLRNDPNGVVEWVDITDDVTGEQYSILVKAFGELVYDAEDASVSYTVVGIGSSPYSYTLDADGNAGTTGDQATLSGSDFLTSNLFTIDGSGGTTTPINQVGTGGIRWVEKGNNGSNGRDGALVVAPRSGKDGDDGPTVSRTNTTTVATADQIGVEIGSIGGDGGNGGDSYLSYHSGKPGGDAGDGGTVSLNNNAAVTANGEDKHGIYAYSRSGEAGNGGSGYAAPSGGSGGDGGDGGNVTVNNNNAVATTGDGGVEIYGLSQSATGGTGGDQIGIVGSSGDGGLREMAAMSQSKITIITILAVSKLKVMSPMAFSHRL